MNLKPSKTVRQNTNSQRPAARDASVVAAPGKRVVVKPLGGFGGKGGKPPPDERKPGTGPVVSIVAPIVAPIVPPKFGLPTSPGAIFQWTGTGIDPTIDEMYLRAGRVRIASGQETDRVGPLVPVRRGNKIIYMRQPG
jgi:hypothetical protein